MSRTVATSTMRTHAEPLRSGSQSTRAALDQLRAGSHMLRMTAKTDRATTCELLRIVMGQTQTSQKQLAQNAEVPESSIADGLNPAGTRNFALEWLLDQDDPFLLAFFEYVMCARGLTGDARKKVLAEDLARLVQRFLEYAA